MKKAPQPFSGGQLASLVCMSLLIAAPIVLGLFGHLFGGNLRKAAELCLEKGSNFLSVVSFGLLVAGVWAITLFRSVSIPGRKGEELVLRLLGWVLLGYALIVVASAYCFYATGTHPSACILCDVLSDELVGGMSSELMFVILFLVIASRVCGAVCQFFKARRAASRKGDASRQLQLWHDTQSPENEAN